MQINIGSILKNLKAAVIGGAIVVAGVIVGLTAYQRYEASKDPNKKHEPKEPPAPKSRIKAELLASPASLFAPAADSLIKELPSGIKIEVGTVTGSKTAAGLVTIPAQGGGTAFQALVRLDGTCTPMECTNLPVSTIVSGRNNKLEQANMELSLNKGAGNKDEYAAAFYIGGQEGAYFLNKFGAPTQEALAKLYNDISPADISVNKAAELAATAVEATNKAKDTLLEQKGSLAQEQGKQAVQPFMGDRATVYQRLAKGLSPAKVVIKKTFTGDDFGSDGLTLQFELEKGKPLSILQIGKNMLDGIYNTYRVDNFSKFDKNDQLRLTTAAGAVMVREAMSENKDSMATIGFGSVDFRGFDLDKAPDLLQQTLANAPGIGKVQSEALAIGREFAETTKKRQEQEEAQRKKELDRKAKKYEELGRSNPDQPFKSKTWEDVAKGNYPGFK